ncbi:exportin-2-like protein [Rhizophagus irregularis DAOM 181602=DAOM 197198]|nr:exportin-2-like protein [Rhizophagus irregularis DAOM 181602=DAOM 197198]
MIRRKRILFKIHQNLIRKKRKKRKFSVSLLFNNYIRRNWMQKENSNLILLRISKIRIAIKENLVNILIFVLSNIQLQLSEVVSLLIAENDFSD